MARNPFGWSYPAGAENDPLAPYNQPDELEECPICGEPNSDDDGNELFADDPSFCSRECYDKFMRRVEDEL